MGLKTDRPLLKKEAQASSIIKKIRLYNGKTTRSIDVNCTYCKIFKNQLGLDKKERNARDYNHIQKILDFLSKNNNKKFIYAIITIHNRFRTGDNYAFELMDLNAETECNRTFHILELKTRINVIEWILHAGYVLALTNEDYSKVQPFIGISYEQKAHPFQN